MDVIEVTVSSTVGKGKSHVLAVIENALRQAYGEQVVIESDELTSERNLRGPDLADWTKPASTTTFVLTEECLRE